MVEFDCKTKMPKPTLNPTKKPQKLTRPISTPLLSPVPFLAHELSPAPEPACSAYETYLNLHELGTLWMSKDFPGWENESIIRPALQALEITFRLISIILNDVRPYINQREWTHRLEKLARDEIEIISLLCEDDETRGAAPIVDLRSSYGMVVPQTASLTEVWKDGVHDGTVVCRCSEFSLLPRLATWRKAEAIAARVVDAVEVGMKKCGYGLGLGEPNLDGKPNLDYDAVCRPVEIHGLKKPNMVSSKWGVKNPENDVLFTIHQIFETWVFTSRKLLERIDQRITKEEYTKAGDDCWVVERIWNLLEELENLHVLMDPDDFLHLKTQLRMKTTSYSDLFCFRSKGLVELTRLSKQLRDKVPGILAVEVDPMGGPVIQESAMELYREKRGFDKIHLLQAFQGVEASVKRFYFSYKQLLVIMMGSLEANGNLNYGVGSGFGFESGDLLGQIYLDPTYYPSLDGAKTFIGDFWEHHDVYK